MFRFFTVIVFFVFAIGCALAQIPPANSPPIPSPTESQLMKGRMLLGKIMQVIATIPLSKPSTVFRVFGVDQPGIFPKGYRSSDLTAIQLTAYEDVSKHLLSLQGIREITATYPFDKNTSADTLGIYFLSDVACVSIDDVRNMFWPISSSVTNPALLGGFTVHPNAVPDRLHEYNSMKMDIRSAHEVYSISLSFSFQYQVCAMSAGISNIVSNTKEAIK